MTRHSSIKVKVMTHSQECPWQIYSSIQRISYLVLYWSFYHIILSKCSCKNSKQKQGKAKRKALFTTTGWVEKNFYHRDAPEMNLFYSSQEINKGSLVSATVYQPQCAPMGCSQSVYILSDAYCTKWCTKLQAQIWLVCFIQLPGVRTFFFHDLLLYMSVRY